MGFCHDVRRKDSQCYRLLPLSRRSFLCVVIKTFLLGAMQVPIDFLKKTFCYKLLFYLQLYREDEQRGNVMMAFSSDSTCTTDLYNASYGHMTWNLTTIPSVPWPSTISNSKCRYSVVAAPRSHMKYKFLLALYIKSILSK